MSEFFDKILRSQIFLFEKDELVKAFCCNVYDLPSDLEELSVDYLWAIPWTELTVWNWSCDSSMILTLAPILEGRVLYNSAETLSLIGSLAE